MADALFICLYLSLPLVWVALLCRKRRLLDPPAPKHAHPSVDALAVHAGAHAQRRAAGGLDGKGGGMGGGLGGDGRARRSDGVASVAGGGGGGNGGSSGGDRAEDPELRPLAFLFDVYRPGCYFWEAPEMCALPRMHKYISKLKTTQKKISILGSPT